MMSEGKTIGQLMEEMRAKAGAQNYHGHGYMDLQEKGQIKILSHAKVRQGNLHYDRSDQLR